MSSNFHKNGMNEPQPVAPLSKGAMVSHYKISRKIGSGGMGEVYLAEDTRLNRQVALKFIPLQFSSDEVYKRRFKREALAAAALDHPNIVTIYEVGEYNGRPFIAMQFIDGLPLKEYVDAYELSIQRIIELLIDLCDGLLIAHQKGIVHRDIKPSNILVDRNARPIILDFGMATVEGKERLTRTGSPLGTIGYMSPEQAKGRGNVDHRSDLFSLGVVLYELITGKAPFKRESEFGTLQAIVQDDPEPLAKSCEDVPDEFQRIVDKMLAKDENERYQTAEDLIEDLHLFKSGQSVRHAPPVGVVTRRPRVKSLAVLYLKNLGVAEDEYLSYGITEDLIIDLTRIGTLRVVPMRSILKYKDSDADLDVIARELDVTMVLDGSIHMSEKTVRISAQLVDVTTGENLWANRWEESPAKLPQIKQSLARGISQVLKVDSSVVRAAQVGDPEAQNPRAYEYYLRGKFTFEQKKDTSDVEVALGLYRRALSLESSLLAARTGIADILIHKAEYEEADRELKSALNDARERELRADEASILKSLSVLHRIQSRLDEAWDYGEMSLNIRKRLGDRAGEAEVLGSLITILEKRARFVEALELSERVLEINRQHNDQEKATKSLLAMGNVYWRMGQNESALSLFKEAMEITHKRNDIFLEAICILNIGSIYRDIDDYDEALRSFEQALQMFTQLGSQENRAVCFNNIAVILQSRGSYRKGLELYEKASTIHKELNIRSEYALTQNNIARTLGYTGEYDRAIQVVSEVLTIARELDYPFIIASATETLGLVHFYSGEYESAEKYFNNALEIAEQVGHLKIMTSSHLYLGELNYICEDYDLCRHYTEKALALAREIGSKEIQLITSCYLAALMVREGRFKAGIKGMRKSLEEAENYGSLESIMAMYRLLGQSLVEHGTSDSDRGEGHAILRTAHSLAREKEVAHEIKWISEILNDS